MAQVKILRMPETKEGMLKVERRMTAIGAGMFVTTIFMTVVAMKFGTGPIGAMLAAGISATFFGIGVHLRSKAKRL